MKITIEIKEVYGAGLVYPVCEKAKLFARLINKKTLPHEAIQIIKALGYTVNVKQKAATL